MTTTRWYRSNNKNTDANFNGKAAVMTVTRKTFDVLMLPCSHPSGMIVVKVFKFAGSGWNEKMVELSSIEIPDAQWPVFEPILLAETTPINGNSL